eukprot:3706821-Pyramimonas_sp.AAC.1
MGSTQPTWQHIEAMRAKKKATIDKLSNTRARIATYQTQEEELCDEVNKLDDYLAELEVQRQEEEVEMQAAAAAQHGQGLQQPPGRFGAPA